MTGDVPMPPEEPLPIPPNWVQVRYPDGTTETFTDVSSYTEHVDAGKVTFFGTLEGTGETREHTIYTGAGVRISTKVVV